MLIYIYIILSILFLIFVFLIIYSQWRFIIKNKNKFDKNYDGHFLFKEMSIATIRFFYRKIQHYLKFVSQYFLHFSVKIASFFSDFTDNIYERLRNKFVHNVVQNKKTVPHFWKTLKKYKREIDEEKEKIEDNSLNNFEK